MKQEVIELDQIALDEMNKEIKHLRDSISRLKSERGLAFSRAKTDGIVRPATVQMIDNDIAVYQQRLDELQSIKYVLVESKNEDGTVSINNNYKVVLEYSNGSQIERNIHLVSKMFDANFNADLTLISTTSPLGKAINGLKIGESTTFATPNGTCNVTVVEKLSTEENELI